MFEGPVKIGHAVWKSAGPRQPQPVCITAKITPITPTSWSMHTPASLRAACATADSSALSHASDPTAHALPTSEPHDQTAVVLAMLSGLGMQILSVLIKYHKWNLKSAVPDGCIEIHKFSVNSML